MKREEWDFATALEMYRNARFLKDDLPDGQWDELREIAAGYREDYGASTADWPEDAKNGFTQEMEACFESW